MNIKHIILVALLLLIVSGGSNAEQQNGAPVTYKELSAFGSGGFGSGGFGSSGFGNRSTATPKPTALPITDDVYAINRLAKSVYMLQVYDAYNNVYATGSGFLAFNNNTLVTNYHVIDKAVSIKAYSDEGYEYMLDSIIAADANKDIAILSFKSPVAANPLPINSKITALRGEKVLTIGSPIGIKNTISTGNITNVTIQNGLRYYQFSAPISSGNSGGALLNDNGYVLGITTSTRISEIDHIQNINYAVPIDYVVDLYNNPTSVPIPVCDYFTSQATTANDKIKVNVLMDCTSQFSWNPSDFTNAGVYHVTINEINGLYSREDDVNESYYEWDAVPDYTYRITVSDRQLNEYSCIFTVKANQYPIKRSFSVETIALAIQVDEETKRIDSLSKLELQDVMKEEHKEILAYKYYLGSSPTETRYTETLVIKSPSHGFCKFSSKWNAYAFNSSSWRSDTYDIGDLIKRIFMQADYESGDYVVQQYVDGYLVAQTYYTLY